MKIKPTRRTRSADVIERRDKGVPQIREHGEDISSPDYAPNYTLRRLGAVATFAVAAWNVAEVTDYGDSIPVISEVKGAAEWVAGRVDAGPTSGDLVKDRWHTEYLQQLHGDE